ncbi:MAG: hypothetical protein SFV32_09985 [Opitutaceae bacterium]|nr:hypothetical protein [Opitutaceae bacterium]
MPYLAFSTALYLCALAYPLIKYTGNEGGWLHPLIFSTVFFGMVRNLPRAAPLWIFGLDEHSVLPLDAEQLTELVAFENLAGTLALISTYVGYACSRRISTPRLTVKSPRRLGLALVVATVVSLVSLVLFMRLSGGFFAHLRNLSLNVGSKEFVADSSAMGLYSTGTQWLGLFLCLYLADRIGANRTSLEKVRFWCLWGGAFLFANVIIYLGVGKRSAMFNVCGIAACILITHLRKVPWIRLAMGAVALLAAFAVIQTMRGVAPTAKSLDDIKATLKTDTDKSALATYEELAHRRGAYSSAYPIFHYVPDSSPLLWGETYWVIPLRVIPRAIWPTKPRGTDFRAGATFFNSVWGIPPGAVAEAYWNFHLPGVAVVYFLFGVFYRWMANLFVRYSKSGTITAFYCYTIFAIGPTENMITGWMQSLIPLIAFIVITGSVRKR